MSLAQYDMPTGQVPIVHVTQLDEAKARFAEVATIVGQHAKTGAAVAGKAWWEIAKTSPQGLGRSTTKTFAWVKDARGADRVDTHYGVLGKFNADERVEGKVATKQSARCEKFEKKHRRRVARRAVTAAIPNVAFVGANAYAHIAFPAFSEAALALAEVGLGTTIYGLIGNTGAVETIRQFIPVRNIGPEQLRKALHDLGISALRKDLEADKPDTRIADFDVDKTRGTRTTTVELCSGVDVQEVINRRRRVASSLRKAENQVILSEGKAGHELVVTIYKDDPTKRAAETWPLAGKLINFFDPIPLGVDASGEVVTASFDESHFYIAGMSRWGKSITMETLMASVILDPRVRLWIWNGTQAASFAQFEPVAEVYVNGNATTNPEVRAKGAGIFALLHEEMDKRGKILEQIPRKMVNNDCANVEGLNPIVVFMDELAPLFVDNAKVLMTAADLAQQCLKYGIFLVCATQTFDKNAVPWSFVGKFQKKIAHRLEKDGDHQAIFDRDYATQGINACKIRTKGEAILDGEEFGHRTLRVYMTDDQTRAEAVERALKARGGVVEKIDLTPKVEEPAPVKRKSAKFPNLLQAIVDMETADDEGKIQCRQIVERLPEVEEFAMFWFDRTMANEDERIKNRNAAAVTLSAELRKLLPDSSMVIGAINKQKQGLVNAPGINFNDINDYLGDQS